MTPTGTRPVPAHVPSAAGGGRKRIAAIAAAVAVVAAVAAFVWRPWAGDGARPLDPGLVAVLPFRVAGADPTVHYLRQGMLDLLQAKLTGEGGPRSADTRSVLAAVRDAGGADDQDLPAEGVDRVARAIGAGRVLQGSIVGPADHLVIAATLLEIPGGRTIAQASVTGPKDSLFPMVDRLTAQVLALGAGARSGQLSALTTTSLDALRAYLDGVAAFRRGAFQVSTPALEKAVQLDSTFALALSALIESDGWHPASVDMRRVNLLAAQYRTRLNPQDQIFLTVRQGSRYPRITPWTDRVADAEKAVQSIPESPEAWQYLGDALFHGGRLADIAEPEQRARQAFEKSFGLDSLYGGPISHLARIAFIAGDTAAQRLWTTRAIALDSAGEGVTLARWDLLAARRDGPGIARFLTELRSQPVLTVQAILFQNPLDSVTIAHQPELLEIFHALAASQAERQEMAFVHVLVNLNRGRPGAAAAWLDTVRTINPNPFYPWVASAYYGGAAPDTSRLDANFNDVLRSVQGDEAAALRVIAGQRERAAADTLQGFWSRMLPLSEAQLAVKRRDPSAVRLMDVADSLWRGHEANAEWASMLIARLYQEQGRADRALRAIRRRYSALGYPNPPGLAESLRLEGQLAALVGDKVGAIRAYRNYLKVRVDPEPARFAQRDSVRAELAAIGDLEVR
jgi:tetratricopeptide (TPR) repeat protein